MFLCLPNNNFFFNAMLKLTKLCYNSQNYVNFLCFYVFLLLCYTTGLVNYYYFIITIAKVTPGENGNKQVKETKDSTFSTK